jgi:competence protein CoiA
MLYAFNNSEEKIRAKPKERAFCPFCKYKVIAKCGKIRTWHWAHEIDSKCDPWFEHETEWHLTWKQLFSKERVEVNMGLHVADIYTKNKIIIELQHSSISTNEIIERESFYGERMMWLIDGSMFSNNFVILHKDGKGDYEWHWKRKCWEYAKRPIFIDFGQKGTLVKFDYLDRTQFQENLQWTCDDKLYWINNFQRSKGTLVERTKFIKKYVT